jgi:4-nitrophenyl phosphatase
MSDVSLRGLRGFLLDMDGVLYRGNEPIPGAAEFVAALRTHKVPFLYVTNNSTTTSEKVAARLTGMGIPSTAEEILGSAEVTAAALREKIAGRQVMVVGEEGLHLALAKAGFTVTTDYRNADAVVVGLDRHCTYASLRDASLAVRRGAYLIATNDDRSLPTELGLVPGAGAVLALVETATDQKAMVIGKPSPDMFHFAMHRLGLVAETTAAVGDRPETDILGGQRAGLPTIAVLTGVGTQADFDAMAPRPDWVFADLVALREAYFGE